MTDSTAPEDREYTCIAVSRDDRVATIRLDRPKALNALNPTLLAEVVDAAEAFDADPAVGAIVVTGNEKAFAAGADIKVMAERDYSAMFMDDIFAGWDRFTGVRTPKIAAVAGYALGGGCELAMMCDLLVAADTAKFGQPEINLGTIPGMGGSQRLTRAVGKAKAMDLILTGRQMDAQEAERAGLVSRIVAADRLLEEVAEIAASIASKSLPVTMVAREAVDAAFETPLAQGLLFERRTFQATFAFEDRAEGMAAFTEKRTPQFKHR